MCSVPASAITNLRDCERTPFTAFIKRLTVVASYKIYSERELRLRYKVDSGPDLLYVIDLSKLATFYIYIVLIIILFTQGARKYPAYGDERGSYSGVAD